MNFGALKGIIGAVAPTLGTALAGPLGGTAAQAISAVLGCKNDPKSISTDIQDARKAHKGDWTPRVFGLFSLVGFIGYIFLVTIQPPDANSDTIVSLVLGYLGGLVSGISSFYFGASHAKE